jgi:hypothetical protein
LKALHAEYERFIENISRTIPVIRVDWDRFRDVEEMAVVIQREYLDANFLRQARWEPTRA